MSDNTPTRSGQVQVGEDWLTFFWEHCDLPLNRCRDCRVAYQAARRVALGQKAAPKPMTDVDRFRLYPPLPARADTSAEPTDVEVLLFGLRALAAYKGTPVTKSDAALMRALRADFASGGEAAPE